MSFIVLVFRCQFSMQGILIDFAVAQGRNFYVSGEAGTGTSVVLAHSSYLLHCVMHWLT